MNIISKNFPINPARGGSPAIDNKVITKTKVIKLRWPMFFNSLSDLNSLKSKRNNIRTNQDELVK